MKYMFSYEVTTTVSINGKIKYMCIAFAKNIAYFSKMAQGKYHEIS